MTKKILYINYMLQYGHINFDLIHINALKKSGYDVKVIVHANIADLMHLTDRELLLTIPKWLEVDSNNGSVNRIMYLLILLYIRLKVDFSLYDKVIVSNIEELSLGLLCPTSGMAIICHGMADSFKSRMKRHFIKKLSHNNEFIVFNENMAIPFHEAGIGNVKIISHGCLPPFRASVSDVMPAFVPACKHLIFHPSNRPNHQFVKELIDDESVQTFLAQKDAYILIRDRSRRFQSKGRIIIISDYLSSSEYQTTLQQSDIILLAYPDNFLYKVSGVSYECFSNKKRLLILSNPSFNYCRRFFNYDPFFFDINDMKEKVNTLFSNPDLACTVSRDVLEPDYSCIIN